MLRNHDILEDDLMPVVAHYFRLCSLHTTCHDLGITGATLANGGINPFTAPRTETAKRDASARSANSRNWH